MSCAGSENAVAFERHQLRGRAPGEIYRVEMRRNLADQRAAETFKPVAPRRCLSLHFDGASRKSGDAGGFQETPQRVAVKELLVGPATQKCSRAGISDGARGENFLEKN